MIAADRMADLTVLDIDSMQVAEQDPDRLLEGRVLWTIAAGEIVFGPPAN